MTDARQIPDPAPRDQGGERRDPTRVARPFWDLFYKVLRTVSGKAQNFYAMVGIFLVAGIVVLLVGAVGFTYLADAVREGGTQAFDVAVLKWIHAHQRPQLTAILREVTYLGTGIVVIVIVGVSALFLWHTEHKHSARLLMASTIGGIVVNNILKLIFHRDRPSLFEWGATAMSSSFPSGHAMSATVVYGTVAYLVARLQKHYWSRVLTLFGAVLLVLTICFTRLYLGVHYPTDVIGGIIIGLAWAAFCMATLEATLVIARRRAPAVAAEEAPSGKEIEKIEKIEKAGAATTA